MNEKFIVEWTDSNGAYQFRIMSKIHAISYMKYLENAGLGAFCYAA